MTWRLRMQAVKFEGKSYRCAAQLYNVPTTTLVDRCSGRITHGIKSGPGTILSPEDEAKLAVYLVDCSNKGYGKSKDIIYMVTCIPKKRGHSTKGGSLSKKWWQGFLKRHPEISMRASQNFCVVRTLVTHNMIHTFYERLLEAMTTNGGSLLEKPAHIYNCDESGFSFDAINKIVAAARGIKHVPRVSKGQHKKVTVLACASADGNTMPPMFIYKNKSGRVPASVQEEAPPGTLFAAQKSGWIDKDLYLKWFKSLFDGHKSHVTEDLIKEAVANGIAIFCLPAHSSHLLQPLDLSLFGPLKRGWVKACAAFNHVASVVVCQRNFAKIFNVAWHTSITPEIIQSGFKKSGIFPYCPNKFDYSKLATSIPGESSQSHEVPRESSQIPRESSQSHEVPRESSQSNQFTSESIQAVLDLYNLEKILTKEQREKFRRHMENRYDLEVDTLYLTWKELFVAAGGKQNPMDGCPCNGACSCSCRGFGFCDCIAISSNQAPPTPKQTTVTLAPVPYTIY
ncbi:uncharacterized protein LOC114576372 [Exaiptasia diaphana]|uniref:DDE-1 domain-containing protein n=1 Tax=Exaiptasia diaphana TaxID=2652724 RepID=A0A913YUI0_EXADI|nr:uncharacterized protein LOC114576372 [Exaiptasia diaphana]